MTKRRCEECGGVESPAESLWHTTVVGGTFSYGVIIKLATPESLNTALKKCGTKNDEKLDDSVLTPVSVCNHCILETLYRLLKERKHEKVYVPTEALPAPERKIEV